jgi:hypothetical protein
MDKQSTIIQFILEYQRTHHTSPTDSIIAKGLQVSLDYVRARLNRHLADGDIQYSFTLVNGKSIEIQ